MTSPVAIMSALRIEIEALLDVAEVVEEQTGELESWVCRIDGHQVTLAICGIGKVSAAVTTTLLHERTRPGLIVFTGVAGGLDPSLSVGDIVLGERSVQHDAGLIEGGSLTPYQAGHLPFFNPTGQLGYTPSSETMERVSDALEGFEPAPIMGRRPEVVWGTILTGDQFVNDEEKRDELFELGGTVVEMEGAAAAQTASLLGMEHLIVRSLSDLASEGSIVDFGRFLEDVASNSARLVRHLLPRLYPVGSRNTTGI